MNALARVFFIANVICVVAYAIAFALNHDPVNGAIAIWCGFAVFVLWKTSPGRLL